MADQERVWVVCETCTDGRMLTLRPHLGRYEVLDLGPCPHCNGAGGWYLEEESDG